MKNKKGFTLIELLAILAILGVIATITVPIVNSVIKKTKLDADHKSVEEYVRAAENFYADSVSDEGKKKKLNTNIINLLDVQNAKAIGEVSVNKEGSVSLILTLNNMCYLKTSDNDDITVSDDVSKCASFSPVIEYDIPPDSCFDTDDVGDGTVTIIAYKCGDSIKTFNDEDYSFTYNDDGKYTNIKIPETIGGKNVTQIRQVFNTWDINTFADTVGLHPGIRSVVIPDTITYIDTYAFDSNELHSVKLPANLQNIEDYSFTNNYLTNVVIPNGVKRIGLYAFFSNQLSNVEIPNSVTTIDEYAFGSNQLTNISLSSNINFIGDDAFSFNKITNLNIPSSVVTLGSAAFSNNLLPDDQAFIYARSDLNGDGVITDNEIDKTNLISYGGANRDNVVIPNEVKTISPSSFYKENIKNIVLPSNLKLIGNYAFLGNLLESVTFPSTLTSINLSAFESNRLIHLDIPSSVTSINQYAFVDNPTLTSITIYKPEGSLTNAPWGAENATITYDTSIIEYIRTNGSQYIDTGIKADNNTSIEMKIELTDLSKSQTLFCSRNDYQVNTFTGFYINVKNFRFDYNTTQSANTYGITINTPYKIYANKNNFYVNDTLASTTPSGTFNSTGNLWLFASYKTPYETLDNFARYKVYYVKIWQGNILVRDFIPKKNDSGVVCLYDNIEKKYYKSAGSAFLEPPLPPS